nr:hypothetical protein LTR18_001543 [Exophiala xenobiotica]
MEPNSRRKAVACTYCRFRKRRCDGLTPSCNTCRDRGLICTYQEPSQQRNQELNVPQAYLRRLDRIEDVLRQHSVTIESLSGLQVWSPGSLSPNAMSGECERSGGPTLHEAQHHDDNRGPRLGTTNLSVGEASSHAKHDLPPLTIPLGHQTSTSNLLTLPQMRSLVGEFPEEFLFLVEENRPRLISIEYDAAGQDETDIQNLTLEKVVTDDYLERYLTLVHPYRPMFDPHDLTSQYENVMSQGLQENVRSALLLSIFALGATALHPADCTRLSYPGNDLIKKALRMLFPSWAVTFKGSLELCQGLVLCALYFCYVVEPLMAWRLVHMASTTIQQMRAENLSENVHEGVIRASWACFLIEWFVFWFTHLIMARYLRIDPSSNILAEFHLPRSGIELVVDKMPLPRYGSATSSEGLYSLADISARSLLNRIHHTMYSPDSLSLYAGRPQHPYEMVTSHFDNSSLRVCEELNRQLETWYDSLPEIIKPDLAGAPRGSDHACVLRLRYWSAKHNIYRPFVLQVTSQDGELETSVSQAVLERCQLCLSACRTFLLTAGYVLNERTPYTFSTAQCVLGYSLIVALAAQSHALSSSVEDATLLLETGLGLLKPWALPGSSIECGFEIVNSVYRKQRLRGRLAG